mmetsp:Transcript_11869/g.22788  ORF Transcript_11869/g.22788 Transcript_11869/m.22788 type:complete len:99 (+) Transcript_11869:887-1183(+)
MLPPTCPLDPELKNRFVGPTAESPPSGPLADPALEKDPWWGVQGEPLEGVHWQPSPLGGGGHAVEKAQKPRKVRWGPEPSLRLPFLSLWKEGGRSLSP